MATQARTNRSKEIAGTGWCRPPEVVAGWGSNSFSLRENLRRGTDKLTVFSLDEVEELRGELEAT